MKSTRRSAGSVVVIDVNPQDGVYLDSNIFTYLVEGERRYVDAATRVFEQLARAGATAVTSEITVAECLWAPAKAGARSIFARYEAIFASGDIVLAPLDGVLAHRAAVHGGRIGLKLIDAIHHVSAVDSGCRFLVSNDRHYRSTADLTVLTLDP